MPAASSSKYVITHFHQNPEAIAIVLGHLGITPQGLRRLSRLYLDRGCAVIAARSPPLDFLLAHHGRLEPVTRAILRESESLRRQCESLSHINDGREKEKIPIVIHMWSNGGAFLWEELMKDPTFDQTIKPHLQYVAYDSCPCYLHMPWRLGPFWRDAFPFPGWPIFARKLYLAAASLSLSAWCLFSFSLSRSQVFWSQMTDPPCQNLVYFYSTNDKVTDAARIDQLIHEQREMKRINVVAKRYDDSAHCRIDYDHAEEYARTIDEALGGKTNRSTGSNGAKTINGKLQ